MIDTMNFRTKSLLVETANVTVPEFWPVALDIGYSSVKGFHQIPSVPSHLMPETLGRIRPFMGNRRMMRFYIGMGRRKKYGG